MRVQRYLWLKCTNSVKYSFTIETDLASFKSILCRMHLYSNEIPRFVLNSQSLKYPFPMKSIERGAVRVFYEYSAANIEFSTARTKGPLAAKRSHANTVSESEAKSEICCYRSTLQTLWLSVENSEDKNICKIVSDI